MSNQGYQTKYQKIKMELIQFVPTSDQKKKILKAIFYEIEQLLFACSYKSGIINVDNALLESTLLHSRVLLDFYEKSKRRTRRKGKQTIELDDVLAEDFDFHARDIQIPRNDRARLNKDLAHITYSRTSRTSGDKWWDIGQVVFPILHRSIEFLEHLIGNWIQESDVNSIRVSRNLIIEIDKRLHGII